MKWDYYRSDTEDMSNKRGRPKGLIKRTPSVEQLIKELEYLLERNRSLEAANKILVQRNAHLEKILELMSIPEALALVKKRARIMMNKSD